MKDKISFSYFALSTCWKAEHQPEQRHGSTCATYEVAVCVSCSERAGTPRPGKVPNKNFAAHDVRSAYGARPCSGVASRIDETFNASCGHSCFTSAGRGRAERRLGHESRTMKRAFRDWSTLEWELDSHIRCVLYGKWAEWRRRRRREREGGWGRARAFAARSGVLRRAP